MAGMSAQENYQRPWPQFSLRTLLIVVALVAGVLAAWHAATEPYRIQREAMAVVTKRWGECRTRSAPAWMRCLDARAEDVISVDLTNWDDLDECIQQLERFPRLRGLRASGIEGCGDDQLRALRPLGSCQRLVLAVDLQRTNISDDGLAHLAPLQRLDVLILNGTRITDTGLRHLAGLPRLTWLYAAHTRIGNDGLGVLADMPMLFYLDLEATLVTDDGLRHLQRSASLERVWLGRTKLTDACVTYLAKCTHLKYLGLEGTGISPQGMQELRKALPTCTVYDSRCEG
jgi:hypothetical protein